MSVRISELSGLSREFGLVIPSLVGEIFVAEYGGQYKVSLVPNAKRSIVIAISILM